ncbi:hypothetical protein K488DRAFT_71272 [Vararia minispora EC-137]|uniref:Uncharacterized protein n=1 Tax=Vararia minispora EC-137 TaxID=1314806 RepID=A0ACB8QJ42_9AGAM|nr:hypothetical protein K488DRAFT_71272 [Vararia minispora EC-137]
MQQSSTSEFSRPRRRASGTGEHDLSPPSPARRRRLSLQVPPRGILRPSRPASPVSRAPPTRAPPADARSRLASFSVPDIDMERDRLLRACGHLPFIMSPCSPQGGGGATVDVNAFPPAPKWPFQEVLLRLKRQLRAIGQNIRDYIDIDDVRALYERDLEDRKVREESRERVARMRAGLETPEWAADANVFGVPLHETVLIASTPAILSGARHDIPIVLFTCIEELYRTGIYQPGLFRELPNRKRHMELVHNFNTAPSFGASLSVTRDSTAVVAAVLSTFLKNLPEPLLGEPLFEPVWNWVVRPSVQCDEARQKHAESEDEDAREAFYRTGMRPRRASRREAAAARAAEAEADDAAAAARVPVLQLLLRLLPTHRLSALYYTCAFFSMVPLSPDNGLALDDIARMFAQSLLGGARGAARHVLVWILRRWTLIADGLLEADAWPAEPEKALRDAEEEVWGAPHEDEDEREDDRWRRRRGSSASARSTNAGRARAGSWASSSDATLYMASGSGFIDDSAHRPARAKAFSADWGAPARLVVPPGPRRASEFVMRRSAGELVMPRGINEFGIPRDADELTIPGKFALVQEGGYWDPPPSRRASDALPLLPPLPFEHDAVGGDGERDTAGSCGGEDEDLKTQLAVARRERDDALRVVQTLRSVLGAEQQDATTAFYTRPSIFPYGPSVPHGQLRPRVSPPPRPEMLDVDGAWLSRGPRISAPALRIPVGHVFAGQQTAGGITAVTAVAVMVFVRWIAFPSSAWDF